MSVRRTRDNSGDNKQDQSNVRDLRLVKPAEEAQAGNKAAQEKKIPTTFQILELPTVVTYNPRERAGADSGWYLVEYGKKPEPRDTNVQAMSRKHKLIRGQEEKFYKTIMEIHENLKAHAIPIEDGPLADIYGVGERLTMDICDGNRKMGIRDLTDRLGDIVRPYISPELEERYWRNHATELSEQEFQTLKFNGNLVTETDVTETDYTPTFGRILSDESRVSKDHEFKTTALYRDVCDDMEVNLVAVGVLRNLDWDAYLARAMTVRNTPNGGIHIALPVVAIFDPSGNIPLYTTTLLPDHPATVALEIFSDKEMLATTHVLQAQMRIRRMCRQMKAQSGIFDPSMNLSDDEEERLEQMKELMKPGPLSREEIGKHLVEIADSLFQYYKLSDFRVFLVDTLKYAQGQIFNTVAVVHYHKIAASLGKLLDDCLIERDKYAEKWANAGIFGKFWLWLRRPKFIKLASKDAKFIDRESEDIYNVLDSHLEKRAYAFDEEKKNSEKETTSTNS